MKILIIPAFFQTRQRPTAGSFFLEQAKALQNAGHQVTILYSDTYSVKCIAEWVSYREENSITPEGIRIYRKKVFCPLKHGMEGHRENFARDHPCALLRVGGVCRNAAVTNDRDSLRDNRACHDVSASLGKHQSEK